jgi:hypothetical protein
MLLETVPSPPPTRGSTVAAANAGRGRLVSPAHAGIDPPHTEHRPAPSSLPRPRGDRPCGAAASARIRASPPPTRGSTPTAPIRQRDVCVSPAHAGIDRSPITLPATPQGLPRPRGDRPRPRPPRPAPPRSPPPTRGSTPASAKRSPRCTVSPAHAGIDRYSRHLAPTRSRLPRPRGDRPRIGAELFKAIVSPPPTRGSTPLRVGCLHRPDVSPAHAGIDPPTPGCHGPTSSLPRPRGDRPLPRRGSDLHRLSPPPTQGSTQGGARPARPPRHRAERKPLELSLHDKRERRVKQRPPQISAVLAHPARHKAA